MSLPRTFDGMLPSTFAHGYASSATQMEGGWTADGKGSSVWDRYSRDGQVFDGSTCAVANDSYHLAKKDVELLKALGAKAYRFSVSWPRVIPKGGRDDPINEAGLKYYSDLVDLLLANDIQPWVTIFHWDTPEELDDRYGAWRNSEEIVKDYVRYATLLFERLGDRVKNWITLNEPIAVNFFSQLGLYKNWDSKVDTWRSSYSLIMAHATAAQVYRTRFQPAQKGKIGVTISADWVEPMYDTDEARAMAQKKFDFFFGVFADPIYLGDWPESVKKQVGHRLPPFTDNDKKLLCNSTDYFCLNSYSASWATGKETTDSTPFDEMFAKIEDTHFKPDGTPIGNPGQPFFLFDAPWAFRKMLRYVQQRYLEPCGIPLVITENGFAVKDEPKMAKEECLRDVQRIAYYKGYLTQLLEAIKVDGLKCDGYFAWTIADNWEWKFGWNCRYGVAWVDRTSETLERVPKDSAWFLKDVWKQVVTA